MKPKASTTLGSAWRRRSACASPTTRIHRRVGPTTRGCATTSSCACASAATGSALAREAAMARRCRPRFATRACSTTGATTTWRGWSWPASPANRCGSGGRRCRAQLRAARRAVRRHRCGRCTRGARRPTCWRCCAPTTSTPAPTHAAVIGHDLLPLPYPRWKPLVDAARGDALRRRRRGPRRRGALRRVGAPHDPFAGESDARRARRRQLRQHRGSRRRDHGAARLRVGPPRPSPTPNSCRSSPSGYWRPGRSPGPPVVAWFQEDYPELFAPPIYASACG